MVPALPLQDLRGVVALLVWRERYYRRFHTQAALPLSNVVHALLGRFVAAASTAIVQARILSSKTLLEYCCQKVVAPPTTIVGISIWLDTILLVGYERYIR